MRSGVALAAVMGVLAVLALVLLVLTFTGDVEWWAVVVVASIGTLVARVPER